MPEAWGLSGVTVRYGSTVALDDVSLAAVPGQVVAVVGGDGAGKTTLLRTLIGRVAPISGGVAHPAPARIGYQPSSAGSWANLTVDENLRLVEGAYGLDRSVARERGERLLESAGLAAARSRMSSQLSGGMRRKLGFCMAMLHAPDLVVLDEPSTGIDPVSRVELWSLIAEAAAGGAAVVMSTTYLDEAERVHNVLVLDAGHALLDGTPAHVLASAPGSVVRITAPDDPPHAWRRGSAWHQWHAGDPLPGEVASTPDMEDAVIAATMAARRPDQLPTVPIAAEPLDRAAHSPLAAVKQVVRRFGTDVAVDVASLTIRGGEIVGLIGANGAGKTTLIRMQLGLLLPSSGDVTLFGTEPSREQRERVGYVPQGLGLYRDLTVRENIDFVTHAYPASLTVESGAFAEFEFDFDELVGDIGLGRQRQLAFACALAHSPELLVLDEPTSGVDPIYRARLWDAIHGQAEAGVGVLVSTHYMQEAEQCDRLVLMDGGRVVGEGSVADIVGSAVAVEVTCEDWAAAFAALTAAGLPVALMGTRVRVVDAEESQVTSVLGGLSVQLDVVPATLEERMTSIARARSIA